MKKQIRRWSNWYKNQQKKSKFKKLVGADLMSLINSCESIILSNTGDQVYTKFRDLGGVNNLGMLIHYSIIHNRAVAISKIEENSLAEREYRFLVWQERYRKCALSAVPIGVAKIQNYTCFISSVLAQPQSFSYSLAERLFQTMGQDSELLSHLALNGSKEGLSDEIDGSTKIKSILVNIVSQFNTEKSGIFYKTFLLERELLFFTNPVMFSKLTSVMSDLYDYLVTRDLKPYEGLVHGDFKPQNILQDGEVYKAIDCQYYTYGIRLWDLAFLYSKDEGGFDKVKFRIDTLKKIDEKLFVLFFYLLASLINVKKKRARTTINNKLIPALNYANKLINP
ncbi:MAG: hypothetical protein ACI9T7_002245 [Oleiphilaceae bacterium]